jgi:hypothetical protein
MKTTANKIKETQKIMANTQMFEIRCFGEEIDKFKQFL